MAVATIVVQVTTPQGVTPQDVIDDLSAYWGYQETVPDPDNPGATIPNPEKDSDFVQRKTSEFVAASYEAALANQAAEAGRQQGITEAKKVSF